MTDRTPHFPHAQMLANRVEKTFRQLHKRFEQASIGAFRLYDRDIPEIRAVVDWYEGHLVLGESARQQTPPDWLPALAEAVAMRLDVPAARVHLRRPTTGPQRHGRADPGQRLEVRERDLRFLVNLTDFQDTGLYLDHREIRQRVRKEAEGKDFLNLFAYTGTFTCAAAKGGATSTTSVDLSPTYTQWAQDNLALNDLQAPEHRFVVADVERFLEMADRGSERWDLAVVDPPSRSVGGKMAGDFDIQRDHRALVLLTLRLLRPGGVLWFMTSHQRFVADLEDLPGASAQEVTDATVPPDFRNRHVHRSWRIVLPE
jgi:23S rRNA (cytosine1962-C5)-methyltransferase